MIEAAARWLGAHALPAFGTALLLLLLGCALLWRLLHRWIVPAQASTLPPGAFLFTRLALGFAVLVAGASVFAEVAEEINGDAVVLGRADQAMADEIARSVPRGALQVFAWLTRLGDVLTISVLCVVVAAVLVWRGRRGLALGWVVAVAGNGVLNPLLKLIFERARPVHDVTLATADGFSFPSGHSSGSVVAYGMLAYVLARTLPQRWHLPAALAAAAVAFTVGCSRIFLRVHFASDVLAGFASGFAWLAVCIMSIELTRHYRRRMQ